MKKIALLAEGSVLWSGMGLNLPLDISESKQALENFLSETREALSIKGYEIVFSEPVRVIFSNPSHTTGIDWWIPENYWVYEDYANRGSDDAARFQLPVREPAFEHPSLKENEAFGKAVKGVYEAIEPLDRYKLEVFVPPIDDLAEIKSFTGADTICFLRLYVTKNTKGLRAAAQVVGYSSYYMSSMDPGEGRTRVLFICADPAAGEVLWQRSEFEGKFYDIDPTGPVAARSLVRTAFKFFPESNRPVGAKCDMVDASGPVWGCRIPQK